MFEQVGELAGRGVVERQEWCADGRCGVAQEPAAALDRCGVAVAFEELAERPQAGLEFAGGGEVDVGQTWALCRRRP